MYMFVLGRFSQQRYVFGEGTQVVPEPMEGYVAGWKTEGKVRDATTDEITAYNAVAPGTGGGGASTFAELTGDPSDNTALAALIETKADTTALDAKADTSALAAKADSSTVSTLSGAVTALTDAVANKADLNLSTAQINGRVLSDVPTLAAFHESFATDDLAENWNAQKSDPGTSANVTGGGLVLARVAGGSGGAARIYSSKTSLPLSGKEFVFDFTSANIPAAVSGGQSIAMHIGLVDPSSTPVFASQWAISSGKAWYIIKTDNNAWSAFKDDGFDGGGVWAGSGSFFGGKIRLWHDSATSRLKVEEWSGTAWVNRISWNYGADNWALPTSVNLFVGFYGGNNIGAGPTMTINDITSTANVDPAPDGGVLRWNKGASKFELKRLVAADVDA